MKTDNKSNSSYNVDNYFKLTVDLLCIADFNGYFVHMNPQWEKILGWSESELKSKPFIEFVHQEDRESTITAAQKLQKGTKVISFENRYLCKDGSYKWLSWNAVGVVNKKQIYASARNIAKTKANELTIEKNNMLLIALDKAQSQYIANVDRHKLFDELLSNLLKLTDSEYGFIGEVLYTEDKNPYLKTHAITNIAWNKETRKFYRENAPEGMEFFNLKSLFGSVMTTGKPVIANDPASDPRRGGLPDGHPPLNHFLGLPFYMGNEFIGMVGIANRPGGYESELIDYLKPFLSTCANLIDGYRNVKERRNAIQALNENEERIRAIVNTVVDGIITINENGIVETFNPAAGKTFGYRADEIIGKNVKLLMPEPYRKDHDNYMRNYIETGTRKIIGLGREVEGKRKDGTVFPMDLAVSEMRLGNRRMFIGIIRDITERRKAEENLRENEERLELALRGADLGLWDWNVLTSEVFFSQRWAEMLGYTLDEIEPHVSTWEKVIHPEDMPEVMKVLEEHMEGRIPFYETEHRVKTKSGKWKWILDRGKVVERDKEGKPLRATGTHLDITERKQAMQEIENINLELRRMNEELRSLDRMKDNFISTVSHELRTPLTSIKGSIGLLLANSVGNVDDEAKEYLDICYRNTDRLVRLINDLLDLSRLEQRTMELVKQRFNFTNLIKESVQGLLVLADSHSVKLIVDIPPDVEINADRDRIAQVIYNLVSNGIKFSGGGEVKVSSQYRDNDLEISVSDTGDAIPVEIKEKIFEKFYQADSGSRRKVGGTGLGLSVSKSIIEQHGGRIWVESGKAKKNRFMFTIPANE